LGSGNENTYPQKACFFFAFYCLQLVFIAYGLSLKIKIKTIQQKNSFNLIKIGNFKERIHPPVVKKTGCLVIFMPDCERNKKNYAPLFGFLIIAHY